MDDLREDCYAVYLRADPGPERDPEVAERPLKTCFSYGEARRFQREIQVLHQNCVIRYLGASGGGD